MKVMVSGLLVNVWIVPSPSDIGHTKGAVQPTEGDSHAGNILFLF